MKVYQHRLKQFKKNLHEDQKLNYFKMDKNV